MNFTAIDFESATHARTSACAVAIVTVKRGEIVDEYETWIQPPGNTYFYPFTRDIHHIGWRDTLNRPNFAELFPEIKKRIEGRTLVAHNAQFDRDVLKKTMAHYGLSYADLQIIDWKCTLELYRAKGFQPVNLAACCKQLHIPLNHHNALSDALACAKLFTIKQTGTD